MFVGRLEVVGIPYIHMSRFQIPIRGDSAVTITAPDTQIPAITKEQRLRVSICSYWSGFQAETLHRGEHEPIQAYFMNRGKTLKHVTNIWRCFRTHGGADGHHCTSVGEIRKREREHEKRRAIFSQLLAFDDYNNYGNIQRYIEYNHCTNDHRLDIVEISYIHFGMSNEANLH